MIGFYDSFYSFVCYVEAKMGILSPKSENVLPLVPENVLPLRPENILHLGPENILPLGPENILTLSAENYLLLKINESERSQYYTKILKFCF